MRLLTTEDKALHHIRALVHGDSGIGKTTSLRTLPAENTLFCVGEVVYYEFSGGGFQICCMPVP